MNNNKRLNANIETNELCFITGVMPCTSLCELTIGDKCLVRSKHPMNPFGDWTFTADYFVSNITDGKVTLNAVEVPSKEYRLLNISDGYMEVVGKYRA